MCRYTSINTYNSAASATKGMIKAAETDGQGSFSSLLDLQPAGILMPVLSVPSVIMDGWPVMVTKLM